MPYARRRARSNDRSPPGYTRAWVGPRADRERRPPPGGAGVRLLGARLAVRKDRVEPGQARNAPRLTNAKLVASTSSRPHSPAANEAYPSSNQRAQGAERLAQRQVGELVPQHRRADPRAVAPAAGPCSTIRRSSGKANAAPHSGAPGPIQCRNAAHPARRTEHPLRVGAAARETCRGPAWPERPGERSVGRRRTRR